MKDSQLCMTIKQKSFAQSHSAAQGMMMTLVPRRLCLLLLTSFLTFEKVQSNSGTWRQEDRLPMEILEPFTVREIQTTSLLECSARTQVSGSNFVLFKDDSCIFGTLTEPIVMAPEGVSDPKDAQEKHKLWVDKESEAMLIDRDFVSLQSIDVRSGTLSTTVYDVVSNVNSEMSCRSRCSGVGDNKCDLFIFLNNACYMGSLVAPVNAPIMPPSGSSMLSIAKGVLETLLVGERATVRLLSQPCPATGELLYASPSINGDEPSLECQGQCLLDERCHYALLSENDGACYLGSFAAMNNGVTVTASSLVVLMSRISPLMTRYESFNHHSFMLGKHMLSTSVTNTNEECFLYCFLDTPSCDFTLDKTSHCYVGTFESVNDPVSIMEDVQDAQIVLFSIARLRVKFDALSSALYYPMTVTNLQWSVRAKIQIENVDNAICLATCHLSQHCDFFVVMKDVCYLCDTEFFRDDAILYEHEEEHFTPITVYYFFKGRDQSNYRPSSMNSWYLRMYKIVTMVEGSSHPNFDAQLYCEALCAMDLGPCYIYSFEKPSLNCHLGAFHVLTSDTRGTEDDVIYTKMSNMMLMHGGRQLDEHDLAKHNEFGHVVTEGKLQCAYHGLRWGLFGTSGDHQPNGHSMAFAHPFLVMCAQTTSPGVNFECAKMDLTADIREWQLVPAPARQRNLYVMMVHGNQVFMIGGRDSQTSSCGNIPDIDSFDLDTNTWSPAVTQMPKMAMSFCAANVQNRFWMLLGGLGCGENSAGPPELHILDPQTLTWARGPDMPNQDQGLMGMACGIYHAPDDHENLVVLSGTTANSLGTPNFGVFALDTVTNNWKQLPNLPDGVIADMRGPEALVSLTRRDVLFFSKDDNLRMHMDHPHHSFSTFDLEQVLELRVSPAQVSIPLHLIPACVPMTKVWELVIYHNAGAGNFVPSPTASLIPAQRHIRMHALQSNRCPDGSYHLRLIWRELGHFNEWIQTSDPTAQATAEGMKHISVRFGRDFHGFSGGLPGVALMSGRYGHRVFEAGAMIPAEGTSNKFPGPVTSSSHIPISISMVQLFIRRQC